MLARVGGGPGVTVKDTGPLVPPVVVTVMLRVPTTANTEIFSLAVAVVPPRGTVRLLTVIPAPTLIVIGEKKFEPVSATSTVLPRLPDAGVMEVSVGGRGTT